MSRYQLVEITDVGFGRRIYTDRRSVAIDVVAALGGRWRIRRQWRGIRGIWRKDHGTGAEWIQEAVR